MSKISQIQSLHKQSKSLVKMKKSKKWSVIFYVIQGYPLSYQSSTKNKFNEKGNEIYYDFKVIGPRGSTEV